MVAVVSKSKNSTPEPFSLPGGGSKGAPVSPPVRPGKPQPLSPPSGLGSPEGQAVRSLGRSALVPADSPGSEAGAEP